MKDYAIQRSNENVRPSSMLKIGEIHGADIV